MCSRTCTTGVQITRGDGCIAVTHRIFLLVCVSRLSNDYPLKIKGKLDTDGHRFQVYLFGFRWLPSWSWDLVYVGFS